MEKEACVMLEIGRVKTEQESYPVWDQVWWDGHEITIQICITQKSSMVRPEEQGLPERQGRPGSDAELNYQVLKKVKN